MSNANCSFCSNKGISAPHGHSIRDFSKNGNPITCPQLLSISCGYCHENGHTVKYCDALKAKKLADYSDSNRSKCFDVQDSAPNKRTNNVIVDGDGFIQVSKEKSPSYNNTTTAAKLQKTGAFVSCFAALDIDSSDEEEEEEEEEEEDECKNKQVNAPEDKNNGNMNNPPASSWANIVSANKHSVNTQWGERDDNLDDRYCGDN